MSSIDYRAYVQAEVEECKRNAALYQGDGVPDTGAVEHLTTEGLEQLLTSEIPLELRTLYLQEYDDIRAIIRAAGLANMTRKDFYDHASHSALKDREYLADSLARNAYTETLILQEVDDGLRQELDDINEELASNKNEVQDRLREGGKDTSSSVDSRDVVKRSMESVEGVNSRGVSTGVTRAE
jgi:hypothetical protein